MATRQIVIEELRAAFPGDLADLHNNALRYRNVEIKTQRAASLSDELDTKVHWWRGRGDRFVRDYLVGRQLSGALVPARDHDSAQQTVSNLSAVRSRVCGRRFDIR